MTQFRDVLFIKGGRLGVLWNRLIQTILMDSTQQMIIMGSRLAIFGEEIPTFQDVLFLQ